MAVCRWDGGVVSTQDLQDQPLHRVGIESMSQSHHLVQDAAKRPDVRLLVVGLLLTNFGREVVRSANSSLSAVIGVLKDSRNAEVTYLDLATLSHEDVLRLQISVENLSVVDVLDGEGHLYEPVQDLVFGVANCMKNVSNSPIGLEVSYLSQPSFDSQFWCTDHHHPRSP